MKLWSVSFIKPDVDSVIHHLLIEGEGDAVQTVTACEEHGAEVLWLMALPPITQQITVN